MKSIRNFLEQIDKETIEDKETKECMLALRNMEGGILEINGNKIRLTYKKVVAQGGFKKIYDIGDGRVLALRNNNDGSSMSTAIQWKHAATFEFNMSKTLRKLGLQVQDYQLLDVKINEHITPALMMTHFKELVKKGLQIRGGDSEKFGNSMLFGKIENITNETYIRNLFKFMIRDIIILIANNINLGIDSFDTLVIKNTYKTKLPDVNTQGSVVDLNQELHFYLMDFYQKQCFFQTSYLDIYDSDFNYNVDEIKRFAELYLNRAHSSLSYGITEDEEIKLNCSSTKMIDMMDEIYNPIEKSLIDEICNGVVNYLKKKKLVEFGNITKLTRSLSNLSYFSHKKCEKNSEQLKTAASQVHDPG